MSVSVEHRFCATCNQLRACDLAYVTATGDGVYRCDLGHELRERVSMRNTVRVAYPEHETEHGCPCWFCRNKREEVA